MNTVHRPEPDDIHATLLPLWIRFSNGEELSPNEETLLRHALRTSPAFRQLINDDAQIDSLLQVTKVDATSEQFLQQVLSRCVTDSNGEVSQPSEESRSRQSPSESNPETGESERISALPDYRYEDPRRGRANLRRRQQDSRRPLLMTITGLICAVLALLWAGRDWWLDQRTGVVPVVDKGGRPVIPPEPISVQGNEENRIEETADTRAFATISRLDDARFGSQSSVSVRKVGDRLLDDEIELVQGTMELTFPGGAAVQVFGPSRIEVVSSGEVRLTSGELSADIPSPAVGFRVTTPTSVIVDLGTVFDVAVESDGTTIAEVRQGHISAVPCDEPELQQWQLSADDLNEVTFYPRQATSEKGPIASAARGFGGQFSGVISLNNSSLKFESESAFERIRLELQTLFQNSPQQASTYWEQMVGTEQ